MRIVFMGTPDFAVPSLRALASAGHELAGVFTQPDKPVGRHHNQYQAPPVKQYALSAGIPVFQPKTLRDGSSPAVLKELAPELVVVAAYGKILPPEVLAVPPFGCINVHASLLPKYRGAAPINWAVLNGESETGVTIMRMAEGLDTGDMIARRRTAIDPDENARQLYDRLAEMGAELLTETVAAVAHGTAGYTPQDDSLSCYAPMLTKELSPIDWNASSWHIHCQVRGLYPWPAATAVLDGVRCKILRSTLCGAADGAAPGSVLQADKDGLKVACGGGSALEILELQPDGKRPMTASAFLAGHPVRGPLA